MDNLGDVTKGELWNRWDLGSAKYFLILIATIAHAATEIVKSEWDDSSKNSYYCTV